MTPYYEDDWCVIYHGDCLDVLPRLSLEADAVVTDPPYKLSQEYSASTDADNLLAVAGIYAAAPLMLSIIKPGGVAAVFYDTRILPVALEAFRRGGWRYLRNLTLYRRSGNAHMLHGWMSTSDFVLLFTAPGATPEFHGPAAHDVYVKDRLERSAVGHPAQKPAVFVEAVVSRLCPEGGLVVDPYMGSGTTLAAAKRSGRRAIGIELEERYCEVAAERLGGTPRFADDSLFGGVA